MNVLALFGGVKVQESTQKWTLVPSVAMSGWMDWAGRGRMEGGMVMSGQHIVFQIFKFRKENGWNHNTKRLYPNQELMSEVRRSNKIRHSDE